MSYTSHSRFFNISSSLAQHDDYILSIDVDIIIRNSLHRLYDIITGSDIAIKRVDNMFTEEGVFFTACNKTTKQFFNRVCTTLQDDITFWDQDTIALQRAYDTIPISIADLPSEYNDKEHKHDSYIWTGSGELKYTDTFQNEASRYTK